MKFSNNTDFTKFPRAGAVRRAGDTSADTPAAGSAELPHDERHLRRRALTLGNGERILVDLPETVQLADGDRLVLDDGREIAVSAAPEELLEVVPRDATHLVELAWHIGNRHLPAEILSDRILVGSDHIIQAMLEGLGAAVRPVLAPFHPLRGAYGGHAHAHGPTTHDHHGHHG